MGKDNLPDKKVTTYIFIHDDTKTFFSFLLLDIIQGIIDNFTKCIYRNNRFLKISCVYTQTLIKMFVNHTFFIVLVIQYSNSIHACAPYVLQKISSHFCKFHAITWNKPQVTTYPQCQFSQQYLSKIRK